ncbi:hypothetical protein C8R44DRAFT_904999 [Mycena epipterygia]|nr:hypothetical protein C8R44DRAFT_904999 [Mycena epipterygia]
MDGLEMADMERIGPENAPDKAFFSPKKTHFFLNFSKHIFAALQTFFQKLMSRHLPAGTPWERTTLLGPLTRSSQLEPNCPHWRFASLSSATPGALSTPLYVNVLPSLDPAPGSAFQSMVNFETRVRSYLTGALLSYSTDAAGSSFAEGAIEFFWHRIQNVVDANQGQLPPLLAIVNAPCCATTSISIFTISRHRLRKDGPLIHTSVSLSSRACELGPSFQTCGSHAEVFACALRACDRGHDKAAEAIGNEMGAQLENIIGQLLAVEINGRRKMTLSSVDSTGSSPNSPPSDEEYVDMLKTTMYQP